jgi:hypothetical protein
MTLLGWGTIHLGRTGSEKLGRATCQFAFPSSVEPFKAIEGSIQAIKFLHIGKEQQSWKP